MAHNITNNWLNKIKADPPVKRIKASDAKPPGLQVRITPTGSITFFSEVRVAGGRKAYRTFGQYPSLNLKKAHSKAAGVYGNARDGVDKKAAAIKKGTRGHHA